MMNGAIQPNTARGMIAANQTPILIRAMAAEQKTTEMTQVVRVSVLLHGALNVLMASSKKLVGRLGG
jgi:hypothetical protein